MAGTIYRPGSSNCDGINPNCRTGENDIAWTQGAGALCTGAGSDGPDTFHCRTIYADLFLYDRILDVIQTGRKTWVEIYIDSPNDIITMQSLTRIRNGIREELKKNFDQIYVELIPDLPE